MIRLWCFIYQHFMSYSKMLSCDKRQGSPIHKRLRTNKTHHIVNKNSARGQITCDMWHVTCHKCYLTCYVILRSRLDTLALAQLAIKGNKGTFYFKQMAFSNFIHIWIKHIQYKKIPATGDTRPSRTCVILEYRFYTMRLSQYHGCCQ